MHRASFPVLQNQLFSQFLPEDEQNFSTQSTFLSRNKAPATHRFTPSHQIVGQRYNNKVANKSSENAGDIKYLGTTLTYQN
jgi:hypothetical protein